MAGLTAIMFVMMLSIVASASAGTITGNYLNYAYTAGSGEANEIGISQGTATTIDIEDYNSTLTESSSSCTKSGTVVTCQVYANGSTNFAWNMGDGNDGLYGTSDLAVKDSVDGGAGADQIDCGAGTDQVDYSTRTSFVSVTPSVGWEANDGEIGEFDVIADTCEASLGGSGPDSLTGTTAGPGRIYGNGGNDVIELLVGSDEVCNSNNAPASQALGGDGDDQLYAADGRNRLSGQNGADVAIGGDGCDNVEGGAGSDTLLGGHGNDFVLDHFETSSSNVNLLDGGDGTDLVVSGVGSDTLVLADGDRQIDSYACNPGTDFLLRDIHDYVQSIWEQSPPTGACERDVPRP